MISLLHIFFYTCLCTLGTFQAATISHYERIIKSPFTGKTYIFHDSHAKFIFADAQSICSIYPNGRLATLSSSTGDIGFLGEYIAVDQPHWIAELEGSPLNGACAAIYSAGAVAIPKSPSTEHSACQNHFNVLCEVA